MSWKPPSTTLQSMPNLPKPSKTWTMTSGLPIGKHQYHASYDGTVGVIGKAYTW